MTPAESAALNRDTALKLVNTQGLAKVAQSLKDAEAGLQDRLAAIPGGTQTFTEARLKATLAQVRLTLVNLQDEMQTTLVNGAGNAATYASQNLLGYMNASEQANAGVGSQPLDLDTAAFFDAATQGSKSSILSRLTGDPAKGPGILARYGAQTIGAFEEQLSQGVVQRLSWDSMRDKLTDASPFLQGKPASWAERIVRTEMMGAYNRASWEGAREADTQLGDMVKILAATFDDRTAADSYAVHGQIRRIEEAFETWFGAMQHPPARPNDREIVIMHRLSWVIPPELKWRTDGEVAARWKHEGRKGSPPERPLMTTIPLSEFGKSAAKKPPGEEEAAPVVDADAPAMLPEQGTAPPADIATPPDAAPAPVAPPEPTDIMPLDPPLPLTGAPPGTDTLNRYQSRGGKIQAADLFNGGDAGKVDIEQLLAKYNVDDLLAEAKELNSKRWVSRQNVLPPAGATVDRDAVHAVLDAHENAPIGQAPQQVPIFTVNKKKFIRQQDLPTAFAAEMSQSLDTTFLHIDLDAMKVAKAFGKSATKEGYASVLADSFDAKLGKQRGVLKDAVQRDIRQGTRGYLTEALDLDRSRDDAVTGMGSRNTYTVKPVATMRNAHALHGWEGNVNMREDYHDKLKTAVSMLDKAHEAGTFGRLAQASTASINDTFDPLRVLFHEELHGFSGNLTGAYRYDTPLGRVGVAMEEAQTETLARKATREYLGTPNAFELPKRVSPGTFVGGHGSYNDYIRTVMDATGEATGDHVAAGVNMENAFREVVASRERFSDGGKQLRAYARALFRDVSDPATRKIQEDALVANLTPRLDKIVTDR